MRERVGTSGRAEMQKRPSPTCVCVPISFLDLLKGRQLLHTTYKMFMAAAGVEGEVLSIPDFEFS